MEPPLPAGIRRERSYRCEEDDPNGFPQVVRPAVFPPGRSSSSHFPPVAGGDGGGGGSDGDGLLLLPSACFLAKEHMFDKVVTPSDVGKLNRLVIPKQHAEKYFPLDAAAGEKGLLLSFEDRTGKGWRFRYSYWNSSQSYVMTKGWSRFVKEKHLDSGDTVSFGRGVDEDGRRRLFIDWKHRPEALPGHPLLHRIPLPLIHDPLLPFPRSSWHPAAAAPPANCFPSVTAYGHLWHGRSSALAGSGSGSSSYLSQLRSGGDQPRAAVQYGFDCGSGARGIPAPTPAAFNSVPAAAAGRSGGDDRGKTVRLFGVNVGYSSTTAGAGATSIGAGSSRSRAPAALPLLPVRLGGGSEAVERPQGVAQPSASSLDLAL